MARIYLDHNATTPIDPRVMDAMLPYLRGAHGNPSSLHAEGRAARRAVEDAREIVARLLGGEPREIVFTSGATEANNFALKGMVPPGGRLAVSAIEHPSVFETAERLGAQGAQITTLAVDKTGRLSLDGLDAALLSGQDVVAMMAANNEFGTIQPWEDVAARCREAGVALHVDAVQLVGKVPFQVPNPGRGTVTISGHKFGAPKGIGALRVITDTRVHPLIDGGGQERLRRGGTENVPAIVGLGVACALAMDEAEARRAALADLETSFLGALTARGVSFVRHGNPNADSRLPGTLCMRFPGVHGETLLVGLDLAGVSISLGSACSSGSVQPSHALAALGINKVENLESVRLSLHWNQTEDELRDAAGRLGDVLSRKPV